MKCGVIAAGLILLSLTSLDRATRWTSPDGKVGFDLPADGSLIEVKNPPAPAVAMWNTGDGTARLVFLTQPNPRNTPLERGGLEEGSIKQIPGGTILSFHQTILGGVPTYTIAATGSQKMYMQQTVLTFSGTFYKVMAAGPTQISDDPRFAGVFKSVAVLDPAPVIGGTNLSGHDLSVKIGEIGFYVLLVAGIVYIIRRARSSPPKSPPFP